MNVGQIGFGRTGKAVATVILQHENFNLKWALRRSHLLENQKISDLLGIESENQGQVYSSEMIDIDDFIEKYPVDIIIDFSSNDGIFLYGDAAARKGIKIISAISHYNQETIKFIEQLSLKTVVFWSPNITLGVNYLLFAAKFFLKIAPWVDIEILEEHFKQKNGISGTALKIAETLNVESDKINSIRAGGIVGKHEIIFGFPYQTVRLIHESISREAFGNGVVFVAEKIINRTAGFYKFEDILSPYFKE